MQFPFWSTGVVQAGGTPVEATTYELDDKQILVTGVFTNDAMGLTQQHWFVLGSDYPIAMAKFLGMAYPQIIEYYIEKFGTIYASAQKDAAEPNRLLDKGKFALLGDFEYNNEWYNAYRIDRSCLVS